MRFLVLAFLVCTAAAPRAQTTPADSALAAELDAIFESDQGGRMEWRRIREAHGGKVPLDVHEAFWSVQDSVDAANLTRIEAIIAERGWPGQSEVGEKGAMTVFLVVQHAPLDAQEVYLPLLEAAAASGEADAWHLAMMTDRVLVRNDLPQRYGSQFRYDAETGEKAYLPMEDPDGLDARLAALGLPPHDSN